MSNTRLRLILAVAAVAAVAAVVAALTAAAVAGAQTTLSPRIVGGVTATQTYSPRAT